MDNHIQTNPRLTLSTFESCTQVRQEASIDSLLDSIDTRHKCMVKCLALLICQCSDEKNTSFVQVDLDILWMIQRQIDEAGNLFNSLADKLTTNSN